MAGDSPFLLYTLIVFASVLLSAFIDNIPYVATMLPVVQSIAALMNGGQGFPPEVFYFGLLIGATLGGNLTPIGASANIAGIGILRKNGPRFFAHRRSLHRRRSACGLRLYMAYLGYITPL